MITWKEIYWYDVQGLASKLREDDVSTGAAFQQLLVFTAIFAPGFFLPIAITAGETDFSDLGTSLVVFLFGIVVNYYGLAYTYQTNQNGDDRKYFLRLAALTLPVTVRLLVISVLPLAVLLGIVAALEVPEGTANLFLSIATLGITILYYGIMGNAFRTASGNAA